MNEQDKDLAAFEEYLCALVKNPKESKPLTTDEITGILQNYGPPEEFSSEEREKMIKLMTDTHERRVEVAKKMNDPGSIRSLGELLQLFSEWKNVSLLGAARLFNISTEQLEGIKEMEFLR